MPSMYVLSIVAAIAALAGVGFYLLCLFAASKFLDAASPKEGFAPGVSILKPLRGADPEMYAAFRWHCAQDYSSEYELVFGVSDLSDPAAGLVQRLQREF